MNKVKFLDLKSGYDELKSEIDKSINESLTNDSYILGNALSDFEENYAKYCNVKHCIGVGNGLDALFIGLKALGIKRGDEVIVPSHTFIATWLAVSLCDAKPVPVEIDKETYNINPDLIKAKISPKTKAIIVVHLYGQAAELSEIGAIAKEYSIPLVEDSAQAHGVKYKNKSVGFNSAFVAWSFYPGKNLGCFGDGGAITTNNEELAKNVNKLRNYGSEKKYFHSKIGLNSRLDTIQAGILNIKLKYLDEWNSRRNKIAEKYSSGIKNQLLTLPKRSKNSTHVWHLYVLKTKYRDKLQTFLRAKGIETLIHYPLPLHKQKAYNLDIELPIAQELADTVLSIPIGPHMNNKDVSYVIDCLNSFKL